MKCKSFCIRKRKGELVMKKKNKVYPMLLLCGLILITSCQRGNTGSGNDNMEISDTENSQTTKKTEDVKNEDVKNEDLKEEKLDLNNYSLEYTEGTDFQSFFLWNYGAKSENGYYFWNDDDGIIFYDNTSKTTVPLCNLPNCKHGTDGNYDTCNAYFNSDWWSAQDSFFAWDLQYYEGNLYITGRDTNGNVNLYKVAKDGSTREISCKLYKYEASIEDIENGTQEGGRTPHVCIHRGYAYVINNDESVPRIRKVKLNSKEEPQVIYETSGIRPTLYRMEGYGDYIFFQTGNFTDESCEHVEGGIYAYNTVTETISLVKKGAISSYIIQDTMIYYGTDTSVNRYDLSTQKDEVFVEVKNAYPEVMADNQYIYITDDSGTSIVYDKEKTRICTITSNRTKECIYGDDAYLFAKEWDDKDKFILNFIDKSDLKSGKAEWKRSN